jgi:hypothetical protein
MTPSRIANKLRGECSYHTPIRVVFSTKKLGIKLKDRTLRLLDTVHVEILPVFTMDVVFTIDQGEYI